MIFRRALAHRMAIRHTNPWSLGARIVAVCAMGAALWFHHWIGLGAAVLAFATAPLWVPATAPANGFTARVSRGEARWFAAASPGNRMMVTTVGMILFTVLAYALYANLLWPSVMLGAAVVLFKGGFTLYCARKGAR